MLYTAKTKENKNNHSESWGMGFLFIFFHDEEDNNKKHSLSLSSNSSSPIKSINAIINRSNSSQLLSKAQSTISICVLLIFITLLLFTLSTFESANSIHQKPKKPQKKLILPHALQGMGTIYRRGSKSMHYLTLTHVVESVTKQELRMFVRLLHRSGFTCKSDILFLFSSKTSSLYYEEVIVEENESFSKIINGGRDNSTSFDPTRFMNSSHKDKENGEPVLGRVKIRVNDENGNVTLSYGSVVGFEADELDPENSLFGFFNEYVPMRLRRWACYPMLLGRVRRNYKHVLLVDLKEHLVLGDSSSRLKNISPETIVLSTIPNKKKNSDKKVVNSGFVLGGTRGIRRLANAMLTEIVRGIMQHKKRNMVSESTLFNQLIANEFILKNVNLIVSSELTHELSSLTGLNSNSKSGSSSFSTSKFPIVRRGNSNLDISYVFKKYLCSSPLDYIAYSDC